MSTAAALLALAAFLASGLASDRHHDARLGRRGDSRMGRRMRLAGWGLLTLSFMLAVAARGWAFGAVLFAGVAMAGAGASFLLLNLAPADWRMRRR